MWKRTCLMIMSLWLLQSLACAGSLKGENIERVKELIKSRKLTEVDGQCLRFLEAESGSEFIVLIHVYEVHNDLCGGDPQTSLRLFSIAYDHDGNVFSDAGSLLGEIVPLD